jgi:hypothetical protein
MWDVDEIKYLRKIYLFIFVLLVLLAAANGYFRAVENPGGTLLSLLMHFLVVCCFYYYFFRVAAPVLEMSTGTIIVLIIVFALIPLLNLILIAYYDSRIFHAIREEEAHWGIINPEFCGLIIWSLVIFCIPYLGLLLAISALEKINASDGELYGKTAAWISIGINAISSIFYTFAFIMMYIGSRNA